MTMTPTTRAMRTLARAILEHAQAYRWQVQGLGMMKLYLPGDTRLHVWDSTLLSPGASRVHDHLQWGLTSHVLSGELRNTRFLVTGGEPNYCWATFKAGVDGHMLERPKACRLEAREPEVYRPGDSYSQEPEEIHLTEARDGTVTLMQKRPAGTDNARIFWPLATEWGSALPSEAPSLLVRYVAEKALDTWRD